MDINRLIDFYDKEQKTVLTAFLVNLPLCYAFLDMYRPSFEELEIITRFVYTICLSIAVTFAAFMVQLIVVVPYIRLIRLFQLLCPSISAFIFYTLFRGHPIIVFSTFLFSTAIGCHIAIRILRKEERDNADNDGA